MVKAEEPPVLLDSLEEEAKNDEESPENGQEIPEDQPSDQDTPLAEQSTQLQAIFQCILVDGHLCNMVPHPHRLVCNLFG